MTVLLVLQVTSPHAQLSLANSQTSSSHTTSTSLHKLVFPLQTTDNFQTTLTDNWTFIRLFAHRFCF